MCGCLSPLTVLYLFYVLKQRLNEMKDLDDVLQLGMKLMSEASYRYICCCKRRTREAKAEAQRNRQLTCDARIRLQIAEEGTKRSEALTREALAGTQRSQNIMHEALAATQHSEARTLAANAVTRVSGGAAVL